MIATPPRLPPCSDLLLSTSDGPSAAIVLPELPAVKVFADRAGSIPIDRSSFESKSPSPDDADDGDVDLDADGLSDDGSGSSPPPGLSVIDPVLSPSIASRPKPHGGPADVQFAAAVESAVGPRDAHEGAFAKLTPPPSETSNSRKRTRSPEPNEIPYKRINHSSLLTLASVATVALEASQLGRPQILYVPVGPVAFAQPSYVCHYVTPPQPTAPSEPGGPAPRKFPCEFCDLSFRRRQDLERHELCLHKRGKIADVELPYVCGCGQRFARRDACSRHVRKGEREHGSACKMPSAMKRGPRMSGRIKASMTFQGMNGFLGGVGIGTEQASSENRLMGGTGMVGGQVGSVADEKS